jgi:hypothetical protein
VPISGRQGAIGIYEMRFCDLCDLCAALEAKLAAGEAVRGQVVGAVLGRITNGE